MMYGVHRYAYPLDRYLPNLIFLFLCLPKQTSYCPLNFRVRYLDTARTVNPPATYAKEGVAPGRMRKIKGIKIIKDKSVDHQI